jgi:hypothetical protein
MAAEEVLAPTGELPVFDGIASLIEQSLVRQAPGSEHEPRFVMLELVREFGLEMLAAAGETEGSRERHARYFLGPEDTETLFAQRYTAPESAARLAAERDNVRLALIWLEERGKLEALLPRTSLLERLWIAPGLYREGQYWMARALARSSQDASIVRFRALEVAVGLAAQGGDYDRSAELVAEGLAVARQLGNQMLMGEALSNAGMLAYRQGAYERAEALLLEAHDLLRQHAESDWYGTPLAVLADTALVQERFDQAAAR